MLFPSDLLLSRLFSFLRKCFELVPQIRFRLISGSGSEVLEVIDHRTGRHFKFPISENAVEATYFRNISTGSSMSVNDSIQNGLRILDPGFQNTAVMKSQITLVCVFIVILAKFAFG